MGPAGDLSKKDDILPTLITAGRLVYRAAYLTWLWGLPTEPGHGPRQRRLSTAPVYRACLWGVSAEPIYRACLQNLSIEPVYVDGGVVVCHRQVDSRHPLKAVLIVAMRCAMSWSATCQAAPAMAFSLILSGPVNSDRRVYDPEIVNSRN